MGCVKWVGKVLKRVAFGFISVYIIVSCKGLSGGVAKRSKATVCKTVIRRFESARRLLFFPVNAGQLLILISGSCHSSEMLICYATHYSVALSLPLQGFQVECRFCSMGFRSKSKD